MMCHDVKALPQFFQAARRGEKTFELRKDDRGYITGDTLWLHEWTPENGYTGEKHVVVIGYILRDFPGLAPGYAILSIR